MELFIVLGVAALVWLSQALLEPDPIAEVEVIMQASLTCQWCDQILVTDSRGHCQNCGA